ncbi:PREDICTED: lysine-specific demethylase phf2-like isoform X1 [Acromyrmex echinatior]|uniref:JmjC domain-containing histone demethylation protein 1D n=1 Tax=Acromyrmex echinatior TaxID=103372 RepID=F4X8H5_ACREC|nr:PREDICTED: lysine-specific demethylase phf2-like isoform X1 [Acromyrmex echinatior]EGI57244.1 JmjC domain-containing histone demethylation protein 1D [Acromyrmex echinatior]
MYSMLVTDEEIEEIEEMETSDSYCFCGRSLPQQFMIQCDVCKEWYHGGCVNLKEYVTIDLDKYHCPRCEPMCGPSLLKIRTNYHRHDYTELDANVKPVQTGTAVFIRELKSRHFPKADEVVKHVKGHQLTIQYLQNNGFETPIIIDGKDGLDMTVPPSTFSICDAETYIGGDRDIDVIDVTSQSNLRMKLREFVEYYNAPSRIRVFNVISLEFTNTGLSPLVEAPYVARKLDWANSAWPRDWPEDNDIKRPEVQKYCLMGVKDSFTDFHIDFGGTSVWYHILRGEKVFYLVKPTPANLQLYQQWMCSSTQSETFFGDQADACYKCVLKQGQTMMIPTGWIHAVLTPVDSLVFGGNFVHSLNIQMQIQIYELERKMKTPAKFQYPGFETINWFAAKKLLKELKELNNEGKKCPSYFLQGVKALLGILKQWNTDKDYSMISRGQIPHTINSQKLLKDLSKEIRHAERYLISLNPPKPERESKRKKRKPLNKDFVDFDYADKMADNAFKTNKATLRETNKATLKETNKSMLKETNKMMLKETNKMEPALIQQSAKPLTLKLTLPKPIMCPLVKTPVTEKPANSNKRQLSKPGKQSPTVIRFKLGNNEVVRSTNDNINVYGSNIMTGSFETTKESLAWNQSSSVYDFHDGSNESDYGLVIDESQKRKRTPKSKRLKRDYDGDVDVLNNTPKNGIEELLKASAYTLGNNTPRVDVTPSTTIPQYSQHIPPPTGSDRASPSTREAIAGMLSFSQQSYSTTSSSTKSSKRSIKSQNDDEDDDQLIENIDKVHQDDDFIYPALDASDDEDYIFKPKAKSQIDEAWNPKARVGPLLPKTNRPAREGVKKTSVEKGLEAAAAKRAKQSDEYLDNDMDKVTKKKLGTNKRTYNKKKQKNPVVPAVGTTASTATSENVKSTGFGSILTSPNRLKDVKAKLAAPVPAERKPKKGMKTAKQRLGKILKLHKMMH